MMAALTPALALPYLAELEPTLTAIAIVAADGTTLAGDPALPAQLAAGADRVLSARAGRHTVIAAVPQGTLTELVRCDLEAVARELG